MQESKTNCSLCGKSAIIFRPHSGQYLCKDCFQNSIEKIIARTISKYKMLKPQDKIILGLSGGKDSITLLYNLIKIQKKVSNSRSIIALTIDEGIEGYRAHSIQKAIDFCKSYRIKHKIITFKESFGLSLDEIIKTKKDLSDYKYACNYCSIIRRRLLNDESRKLGGTVLAMGHNLTDFAETFLMNILYKRINLIGNQYLLKSENQRLEKYYVKKIFPLMRIPEEEILKYIEIMNLEYYASHCPYREIDPIVRKKVLEFIQSYKSSSPEIEFNLLNGFLELSKIIYKHSKQQKYKYCKTCGYPIRKGRTCTYCNLKKELLI